MDIDGEDSTISWTNAIDKTDLEVILPVKFNRTVNDRELDLVVDDEEIKLPTLTVLDEDEKVKQDPTVEKPDGDLSDDNILKEALADEKASDEAEAVRQEQSANKEKEAAEDESDDAQKETKIDENSSQADAVEEDKQSNLEKAEALLKEKRAADQKKAEEKSRQAIEDRKKAQQQSQPAQSSDTKTLKNRGEAKEAETPQTPDVADLKGAKEAVADDDAEGEEPSDNQLSQQLSLNNVFEDEEGSRDITDLIKGADTPQFFKSIKFTYTDKDGETKSKDVPPVLDDILELPEVLQIHKILKSNMNGTLIPSKKKLALISRMVITINLILKG